MMYFLAFPLVLASFATAAPLDLPPPPPMCEPNVSYNVTDVSPNPVVSNTSSVVAMTCSGAGGACSIGASYSYSVSWTISVGLNLNLDPQAIQGSAGLSIGYTHTTTTGSGDSASFQCPAGPWDCGIQVNPWVKMVSGNMITTQEGNCGPSTGSSTSAPYVVEFPQTVDNLPNVNAMLCACPNGPGVGAPGAPPTCSQNC